MIHMSKVAVGIESLEHLADVQKGRRGQSADGQACVKVYTRFLPKRARDLEDGGSLYWIVKGHYLARQRIIGFETYTSDDGKKRCLISVSPEIVPTMIQPRRAHQGWRYLKDTEAPADMSDAGEGAAELPAHMAAALRDLGLL
tara:strand:+ start:118 stop:546 length:429 start_codon:yes stop_codon:yes gene_type:complete